MSQSSVSESEIFVDIRRVARLLNHSPSSVEYMKLGRHDVKTLRRRFNIPWRHIVESSGLRYTPRTSRRIPTTEDLRRDLRRVLREVGHPPIRSEYQTHGRFGAETVRRRSGARRWEDAVASLIGVNSEEVKSYQRRGGSYRTTKEWLARLRELSQELGHAPTTSESNAGGINAQQLRLRVGGNWTDVLKAAGINLLSRNKYAALRATPTEELIEDVVAISRRLGRPAKAREYAAGGHYSHTAVSRRLGGWGRVKKIVAALMNKRQLY